MVDDKSKVKDLCSDHQIQMRYFCETCKVPFCPDCSTFGDGHKGHKIALLSKIYQGQRDRIHQDLGRFDLKYYVSYVELESTRRMAQSSRLSSKNSPIRKN